MCYLIDFVDMACVACNLLRKTKLFSDFKYPKIAPVSDFLPLSPLLGAHSTPLTPAVFGMGSLARH